MKNDIKFEKIHSNKKNISFFVGIVCVVILLITLVLTNSLAKYRSKASVPIVDNEVNYVRPDLDVVALYIDGVQASELDSSKNYTLDTTNSICTYKDGSSISNLTLNYDSETGSLSISPFTTRGTKCYLYFDIYVGPKTMTQILAGYTISTRSDFSEINEEETTGIVYSTTDWVNNGTATTYYFTGNPTDNWVYFAGYYWRIIRMNGDGTVRLIYGGVDKDSMSDDQIGIGAFNSSNQFSYYVGLSYFTTQHGTGTESAILIALNNWYNGSSSGNLELNYGNFIDSNVGFCSDRNVRSGDTWVSSGSTFYYAAYERLFTNKKPSLACSTSDILNIPIGLITADEAVYAGGVYSKSNTKYYLYTGQSYWMMTPFNYYTTTSDANVFYVDSYGNFSFDNVDFMHGIRPVINLKADTRFTGTGTIDDPYQVVGA